MAHWQLVRSAANRPRPAVLAGLLALPVLAFLAQTLIAGLRFSDLVLPYLGEAVGRATAGIGGAGLLLAAAAMLGLWISRLLGWSFHTGREQLTFVVALGIGA